MYPKKRKSRLETQVLIIGGGATGTGLARDLALRGVHCILVEKGDINAGASGANHGLLHSGARYVFTDPMTAKECREESELLKKLVPQCIESTGGLFVAVEGDDEGYVADFPHLCSRCGVPCQELEIEEASELEPALSEKLIAAYKVEDATIDPFRLSLENITQAQQLGTMLLRHTKAVGFERSNNRVHSVRLMNTHTGEETVVKAEQVVNAAGAWAAEVASLAGVPIDMLYSKGSMLVTSSRITQSVVNRLRKPLDGDILVPSGKVSLLGTTSVRISSLEQIHPTIEEADLIVREGTAMIPILETTRYIRAYAGVRPLLGSQCKEEDRQVSRGFALLDHVCDGLENFTTISGGKLTTYRFMAEKTADLVCQRLGVSTPCLTRTEPLPAAEPCQWTEPGLAAKLWLKHHEPEDSLLCECEMMPKSAIYSIITSIINEDARPDLLAIGQRSRVGKGPCQGTFCGMRVTFYLYERGELHGDQGVTGLRDFLQERWKGQRPILRGGQIIPAELKEALYCGLLSLEL
jgi:glycerol-3-phosphate dehydrogenase